MTTFRDLHDRLTARGIAVGVEGDPRGHAITLADPDGLRAARVRVRGARFDRAATAIALSADFSAACGLRFDWPEVAR